LAHSYLPLAPARSELLVEALAKELAKVFDETGSFSSTQQSLEFVRAAVTDGIKTIAQLSLHSESAFVVEVTSSDMTLLFAAPGTMFDDAKMDKVDTSNNVSAPRRRDKVAGTTEVGVGKSVCMGPGKSRREEILLKTKVVLEKDLRR